MRASRNGAVLGLAALALVAGCLEDPAAGGGSEAADPREEALAFGLTIVDTYFTQDFEAFHAVLADEIYTLEGEGPFTRADVRAWSEEERPYPGGRDYSEYTLEDYLAAYDPFVWTYEEAVAAHPEFGNVTWDGWEPDGDDYVFVGNEVREGAESFLWDDLLSFGVTHESGEWAFKAFSG